MRGTLVCNNDLLPINMMSISNQLIHTYTWSTKDITHDLRSFSTKNSIKTLIYKKDIVRSTAHWLKRSQKTRYAVTWPIKLWLFIAHMTRSKVSTSSSFFKFRLTPCSSSCMRRNIKFLRHCACFDKVCDQFNNSLYQKPKFVQNWQQRFWLAKLVCGCLCKSLFLIGHYAWVE